MAINKRTVLKELLSLNITPRLAFVFRYWCGILKLRAKYTEAFDTYTALFQGDHSSREDIVRALLLNCFNNLLTSSNLLIECSLTPSGNLMRNFAESLAAAMLLASPKLSFFERFERNPRHFQLDKMVGELKNRRVQAALSLDSEGVDAHVRIHRFYHLYSHATIFSMAVMINTSRGGRLFLGTIFDPLKARPYRIELIRRIGACKYLKNAVILIKQVLDGK
jgi:hypothetical protein